MSLRYRGRMMEKRLVGGLRLVVVGCVLLAVGCGSDGNGDSGPGAAAGSGGAGVSGGSAGSGGSAVGGSGAGSGGSAGASAPRKGAVSLDFQSPAGCVDPAMTINLPDGAQAPVDSSGVHAQIANLEQVDGNPARVTCITSKSNDGTWMVEGQLTLGPQTHFDFYAHGASPGQRNVAGFGIRTPTLSREHTTKPGSESGVMFTLLEPGTMSGTIDVPHLFNFKDDTECVLGVSYFHFENCRLSYSDP
jgi:hypothetical protein